MPASNLVKITLLPQILSPGATYIHTYILLLLHHHHHHITHQAGNQKPSINFPPSPFWRIWEIPPRRRRHPHHYHHHPQTLASYRPFYPWA